MELIEVIIIFEIIFVNVTTIARCCERKYKPGINILVIVLFSILVFYLGYQLMSRLPFYGNGNGLFAVFGFLYLIPMGALYKEKVSRLFIICCMSWVYTLGVFALAVQWGKTLDVQYFYRNVFLIETILFLVFTIPFHKIVVRKYIYILENTRQQGNSEGFYLALTSIMHFFTMLGANIVFSREEGSWVKVLVILLLLITMFFMYNILYQMIKHLKQADIMNRTAHYDELTGLRNRLSMFDDLQEMLKTENKFSVLFMDLDKFKNINDVYGHVIGDQYLQHFAKIVEKIIGNEGRVYRFGGDEFLVIYDEIISDKTVKEIELCREWNTDAPCPFNYVSVGVQKCEPPHMDLEKLLERADKCMYQKKMAAAEKRKIE